MVKDAAGNWVKNPGNLQKLIDMAGPTVKGGVDAIKQWWDSYNPNKYSAPSFDTTPDPYATSTPQNTSAGGGLGGSYQLDENNDYVWVPDN